MKYVPYEDVLEIAKTTKLPADPRILDRARKRGNRVFWLYLVGGLELASLFFALSFGLDPVLGPALLQVSPLGFPWFLLFFAFSPVHNASVAFHVNAGLVIGLLIAAIVVALGIRRAKAIRDRESRNLEAIPAEHGNQHWETPEGVADSSTGQILPHGYDIHTGWSKEAEAINVAQQVLASELGRASKQYAEDEVKRLGSIQIVKRLSEFTTPSDGYLDDKDPFHNERPVYVQEERQLVRDLNPDWYARWAKTIEKNQKSKPGLMLGQWWNPYRAEWVNLVDYSDRFYAMVAPTRGGKGVSFVLPVALSYPHSIAIINPKGDTSAATIYYRREILGQRIFIVNPFANDGRNARWNPIDEIRWGTSYEEEDVASIARQTVTPEGEGFEGTEGVWKQRSFELLQACIIHLYYCKNYRERSLRAVDGMWAQEGRTNEDILNEMSSYVHDPDGRRGWIDDGGHVKQNPIVRKAALSVLGTTENERNTIIHDMQGYLRFYRAQVTGANTATSDFSIQDWLNGPTPSTIFLNMSPDQILIGKGYLRLFVSMLINRNIKTLEFGLDARPIKSYRWEGLLLLDEMAPALGKMDLLESQTPFVAQYGLRPTPILQDLMQLRNLYGDRNDFEGNIHGFMLKALNNPQTMDHFSSLWGDTTYGREEEGANGKKRTVPAGARFIRPNHLREMNPDEAILSIAHRHPIPMRSLKYYRDDSMLIQRVRRVDAASDTVPLDQRAGRFELDRLQQEESRAAQRRIGDASALAAQTNPVEQAQLDRLLASDERRRAIEENERRMRGGEDAA